MFGLDPVTVLDDPVALHRQVREAAVLVWAEDQAAIMNGDDNG